MRSRVGVALGVIAVVLAILAAVGPWWTVDSSGSLLVLSYTSHVDFGLFGGTGSFQSGSTSKTNTTSYSDAPHVGSVFFLGMVLLILGLLIGIGMLVVGAMSGARPSLARLGGVLGVLAFVVVLLSALYVMSSLPGAVNQDSASGVSGGAVTGFWGTQSGSLGIFGSITSTWAAGWGWYLALVAAIVFLNAGVALLLARRPAMAAVAPLAPPSP